MYPYQKINFEQETFTKVLQFIEDSTRPRDWEPRRLQYKVPLRLLRLCVLGMILPAILVAGPMYLRYRVYSEQLYPLSVSDQRLIDAKVSTTWCQVGDSTSLYLATNNYQKKQLFSATSDQSKRDFQRLFDERRAKSEKRGVPCVYDQTLDPGGRHEGILGVLSSSR